MSRTRVEGIHMEDFFQNKWTASLFRTNQRVIQGCNTQYREGYVNFGLDHLCKFRYCFVLEYMSISVILHLEKCKMCQNTVCQHSSFELNLNRINKKNQLYGLLLLKCSSFDFTRLTFRKCYCPTLKGPLCTFCQ